MGEFPRFSVGVVPQFSEQTVYPALGSLIKECEDCRDFGRGGASALGFVPKDDPRSKVSGGEGVEFGGYVYEATEEQLAFLQGGTVSGHGVKESAGKAA